MVGGFHQAAACTQLFFAALQRRHLLRLNLHTIQSFYLHPFKKRPADPPQHHALPGGRLNQRPQSCLEGGCALIKRLRGCTRARRLPTTRHCPFQTHIPLLFLQEDFPGPHGLASQGGDGVGDQGAPGAPQALGSRRAAPGRGPRWRTDSGDSATAPRTARAGVAAFVPGDLLGLREKLKVRWSARDVRAEGRCQAAAALRPLPTLATYTKGRCTKFACLRRCATPAPAPASGAALAAATRGRRGEKEAGREDEWGWEEKVRRRPGEAGRSPEPSASPIPTQDSREREGRRFPRGVRTGSRNAALSVFHTCLPLPPIRMPLGSPRTALGPGRVGV